MPDHHTLLELVKISEALRDALREALHFARDLLDLANETLAGDPQAGEHARGMALHMAEQVAAVESMLGPIA